MTPTHFVFVFLALILVNAINNCYYDECGHCTALLCDGCKTGAYKDNAWYYCYKCRRECTTCSTEFWCNTCSAGYFLYYVGSGVQTCMPCANNCKTCSSLNQCDTCNDGFYMNNGNCIKCGLNCKSCANNDMCDVCERGYTNVNGICTSCTTTTCTNCQIGTYYDSYYGKCQSCPYECTSCTSSSTCSGCKEGYYLSGASCVLCNSTMTGCLKCGGSGQCTFCSQHYRLLDSGTCSSCPSKYQTTGVDECSNMNYPRNCMSGYVDPYDYCQKCPDNCHTCTTNDQTCNSCKPGFYFSNKACHACSSNCEFCTSSTCERCKEGYVLENGVCNPCGNYNGCSYCLNECKQCNSGYTLSNGRCVKCQNCNSCNSTSCFSCENGYTFSSGNTCGTCSSVFNGCDTCSTTSKMCTRCQDSYTFKTLNGDCDVCQTIFPHCTTCSQTKSDCTMCDYGYTKYNGQCVLAAEAIAHCVLADRSVLKCYGCESPYVISSDSLSCEECSSSIQNCRTCEQTSHKCKQCSKLYGVNYQGQCELCSSNSTLCTSAINGICGDGKSPYNGFCYDCSEEFSGCSSCSGTTWGCEECSRTQNLVLIDGKCSECNIDNCTICNNKKYECETCAKGYYVENGICIKDCDLEGNCFKCGKGKCAYCSEGFGLNSQYECIPCDDTICVKFATICEEGMYPSNGYCYNNSVYKPECESMSRVSNRCLMCNEGYGNDESGQCKPCESGCERCLIDYQHCNACKTGYALQNGKCVKEDKSMCDTYNEVIGCEGCVSSVKNASMCSKCSISGCYTFQNSQCLQCQDNFIYNTESNICQQVSGSTCKYFKKSQCISCNDGYYLNNGTCHNCPSACTTCQYSEEGLMCLSCIESTYFLKDHKCLSLNESKGCTRTSFSGCAECGIGYYLDNQECLPCQSNCNKCTKTECFSCANNMIVSGTTCETYNLCVKSDGYRCSECLKGNTLNDTTGLCVECVPHCSQCVGKNYCLRCEENYILVSDFSSCQERAIAPILSTTTRVNTNYDGLNQMAVSMYFGSTKTVTNMNKGAIISVISNCLMENQIGCNKCAEGFYLLNNACEQCQDNCLICYNNNECLKCKSSFLLLSNSTCVSVNSIEGCLTPFLDGTGCAVCENGYLYSEKQCVRCAESCGTCLKDASNCLTCAKGYFRNNSICVSLSTIQLCEEVGESGCQKCADGYFVENGLCQHCDDGCQLCSGYSQCTLCTEGLLLKEGLCKSLSSDSTCTSVKNGVCQSCMGGYKLVNGECFKKSKKALVAILVVVIIVVIVVLIAIILTVAFVLLRKKKMLNITTFKIDRSNVIFKNIENTCICINKMVVRFNEDYEFIPVGVESKELLCIGNTGKDTIKLQLSIVELERCEIEITPKIVCLKAGEACEFSLAITPLCTCSIQNPIKIIFVDLKTGKEKTVQIKVETQTVITSKLDYSEIKEDFKLGEGSFGVVYKGKFRENCVAIKKLKNVEDGENVIEEFEKEVSMLDKFRSEYIVHFYGAVLIPNRLCIVTEFSEFGSLSDMMYKRNKKGIETKLKVKMLTDVTRGISYLHENGVLHRDIKPDNVLVFSMDLNEKACAKLTDFGSSRNINMLMTNMTFTKSVGTPVYMAPEVLKQDKYNAPSDIYSFAITMLEVLMWGPIYTKQAFKFPWNVAEFVVAGKRVSRPEEVDERLFNIVEKTWNQFPKDRLIAPEIVKELEAVSVVL
ncbi:protein serine/threonine kinase, putative [Entamoeba invadens IP1]|uniref:Protein serine/threonine kinase, putative n=1 Tax=Entamoeba invadens IP1 TaxID=370355 RepID=A0A0A1UB79_ENTIV|nr:protein serine/threonine kinase, putative [Entamoeba invadens IP1]ELP90856.1 protein serine/threonine kinase, putative [Entamoeba invadens IP1]|eukprot:XP_004257627.1 protein serine/threonine kinase, putative [Entamoeba invadens IP1]